MFRILIIILLGTISLNIHANNSAHNLFETLNQRLSYMPDVALYKAIHHKPIEDLERENLVINKTQKAAVTHGLAKEYVTDFFLAQIAVAKAIQYRYRADLLAQPSTKKPRDLQTEVRPALITLGNKIIQQLAQYIKENDTFKESQRFEFNRIMTNKYITDKDKALLFNTLLSIKN